MVALEVTRDLWMTEDGSGEGPKVTDRDMMDREGREAKDTSVLHYLSK